MKISKGIQLLAMLAALAAFTLPAGAQDIQQRKENQQDRIAQGVKNDTLTPRETSHLEGEEAGLNHEEHAMRQADNGHLTAGDRKVINHQQNHVSRQIYRDKHNGK